MRIFIALTRQNTAAALKALFDSTSNLNDGVGFTDFGALAAIPDTDAGGVIQLDADTTARIWPDGAEAPYAWVIAHRDIDLYRIGFGGMLGTAITVLTDALIIDDRTFDVAALQVKGSRPVVLRVAVTRTRRVVDASSRMVIVDNDPQARGPKGRPPTGSDSDPIVLLGRLTTRDLRHALVMWDTQNGQWKWISVSAFLRNIYTESDLNSRYIAFKTYDSASPMVPDFSASDFTNPAMVGVAEGHVFPATPDAATAVWVALAIPTGVRFDYLSMDRFNNRNVRSSYGVPYIMAADIGGDIFDIYRGLRALSISIFGSGYHIYFAADSVNP